MTLVTTASLVADAVARGRAVAAFNVITLEHAEAIVTGATSADVGVILQLSENAIGFHAGAYRPLLLAARALAADASVGIALHLDHIESPELAEEAMAASTDLGLGSIMVDASRLADDQNVALTARLAGIGHRHGLWVEAELGEVGGKDGAHAAGARTSPPDAAAFVLATGIDGLAVAVGSSHAMLDRSASLDLSLISALAAAVPVPLVLHGSSGVPDATLSTAVDAGIRKVNIGTALNVAGTGALRAALAEDPSRVDPRPALAAARTAMADAAAHFAALVS